MRHTCSRSLLFGPWAQNLISVVVLIYSSGEIPSYTKRLPCRWSHHPSSSLRKRRHQNSRRRRHRPLRKRGHQSSSGTRRRRRSKRPMRKRRHQCFRARGALGDSGTCHEET